VADARFCHKCGRPLFELVAEEEPEPAAVEAATPPPVLEAVPTEISFRNMAAVRVGFIVAGIGMLAVNLASLFPSAPLQLLAFIGLSGGSGALAVWLYRRRTGQKMSVKSGAQLGWITGVFSFVIMTVLTTLTIATVGLDKIADLYRTSAARTNVPAADVDRFFGDPAAVGMALIVSLVAFFAAYTIAASLGGAFGAKLLDREGA
jgi:uncharacterized membrane protein YbaN (DUF454 family)